MKKKMTALCVLLLLSTVNLYAIEYSISKNTTWTKSESPVLVEKDLVIERGARLTIEPGVTVNFKPNLGGSKAKLIVYGGLHAVGKENERINFTSESIKNGSWGGIIFQKESTGSIEYCNILYAASGISCFSASPKINQNNLESNEVGIVCEDHANPVITNNYFTQNGTFQCASAGIACSLYSDPIIEGNRINENIGYGIYVSTFSKPRIANNRIENNRGRGIVSFSASAPAILNNYIARNSCSCGIILYQSNAVVLNNDIHANRAFGIAVTLGGTPVIQNNFIHENGNGMLLNAASPLIAFNLIKDNKGGMTIWDDSNPIVNYNRIENNDNNPAVRLGRISKPIDMQNNWWGTADKLAIEKSIVGLVEKEDAVSKIDYSNFQENELFSQALLNKKINLSNEIEIIKNMTWAISGDNYVYVSFRENNWDICVTNREGSVVKNLTKNNIHDIYPIFSPDGKKVVCTSRVSGNLDIRIINMEDGSIKQITDTVSNEEFPSWSPDGTQIAFKQVENLDDYYTINLDGTARTRLSSAPEGYHNILFMWMPVETKLLSAK